MRDKGTIAFITAALADSLSRDPVDTILAWTGGAARGEDERPCREMIDNQYIPRRTTLYQMNSIPKRNFRDKNRGESGARPVALAAGACLDDRGDAAAERGRGTGPDGRRRDVRGVGATGERESIRGKGKRVTNARRAFGGGDGGAKAEAARKEALASARESSSAAARARRLLDYSPGSSTPDGTGRAVGSVRRRP